MIPTGIGMGARLLGRGVGGRALNNVRAGQQVVSRSTGRYGLPGGVPTTPMPRGGGSHLPGPRPRAVPASPKAKKPPRRSRAHIPGDRGPKGREVSRAQEVAAGGRLRKWGKRAAIGGGALYVGNRMANRNRPNEVSSLYAPPGQRGEYY